MDWMTITLSVLSSVAGIILVIGSLLLLWTGRSFVDSEGNLSHVELPMGIKIDTHAPVLVIFLFGVFMVVFPVYYDKNACPDPKLHTRSFPEMVKVTAPVKSPRPINLYAVIAEQNGIQNVANFTVPFGKDLQYRVIYGDGSVYHFTDPFSLGDKPEPIELKAVELQLPSSIPPLAGGAKVDPATVAEFK